MVDASAPATAGAWLRTDAAAEQALRHWRVMHSEDLEQARDHIARVYKPHELAVEGRQQCLQARMHHRPLGPALGVNRLAHGAAVRIDPDQLDDFFLVQMPLAGSARVWHQGRWMDCGAGQACVLSARLPLRMHWSPGCDQFMLRIDRTRLLAVQQARSGRWHDDAPTLALAPHLPLDTAGGRAWWQLMHYLAAVLDPASAAPAGLQAALLEDHVIAALLAMACQGPAAPAHPEPLATRRLQRLEDYVLAHLDEPLTLRTLAEVAQTSVRSVQSWFAQARGTTPGAYIRARRLERVRHELLHPAAGTAVTAVALRWGFEHAGRFAAAYRAAYGETPSATLQRAR